MSPALLFAASILSSALTESSTESPAGSPAVSAGPNVETPSSGGELFSQPWWEQFADLQLRELIHQALMQNADVQAAALRSVQSRASSWQQLAPTLPVLRVQAQGNGAPTDSLGFQFGGIPRGPGADEPPEIYYTGNAFLTAQANIDLGKSITAWSAGQTDAEAAAHDADALSTSLILQIAQTYFDLQTAFAQLEILREQEQTNQSLLNLTELRFAQGTADGLDVLQQKQQVAAATTRIPPAAARVEILQQTLRVLIGQSPTSDLQIQTKDLPTLSTPAAKVDWDTLEDRVPELRAAKARVHAAEQRVLSAQLAFLPSIGLTGQVGQQGIVIEEENSQSVWGVGASIALPLFEGGRKWSAWKSAEAALASAKAQRQQLRFRTQQIIENALARDIGLWQQRSAAEAQSQAAEDAMRLAQERYAAGLSNYQALFLAVNASQNAQLSLLDTRRQGVQARVQYLNAVGGTWSLSLATATTGRKP